MDRFRMSVSMDEYDKFQWGHDFSAMDSFKTNYIEMPVFRFNGATTFQPWIGFQLEGILQILKGFQWGHDFSAMDRVMETSIFFSGDVSMGPRLFSHG